MSELLQRRVVMQFALTGVLVIPAAAHADPPVAAGLPPAAQPIWALTQALLDVMRVGNSAPFVQRYNTLAPVIERTFDLDEILRASVGLSWSFLPAAQQTRLTAEFPRYTVATYVANFANFTGQRFEISPNLRPVGNGEQIVATKIIRGDGRSPLEIDFVMRQIGRTWKAVDVLMDGSISRVAAQRSDFRSLLADGSGDALIARLQRKVTDLSGGALT
jgi:phospholipid transport system substrate-binding protein